jgi:hypothetical protein
MAQIVIRLLALSFAAGMTLLTADTELVRFVIAFLYNFRRPRLKQDFSFKP